MDHIEIDSWIIQEMKKKNDQKKFFNRSRIRIIKNIVMIITLIAIFLIAMKIDHQALNAGLIN